MSNLKFSALCPTRMRPDNMTAVVESMFNTISDQDFLEFIFYIDDDDLVSSAKAAELQESYNVRVVQGPRIVLSEMWNKCYDLSKGDILFHCGDDIIMRTEGWDVIVENKFNCFEDKILFVYGDDGYAPKDFGTHGFIHRRWAEAVGYFVPPHFSSDFNDTWLNAVAKLVKRHFWVPIFNEHLHPLAGKAEWDITHQERVKRGEADNVLKDYNARGHERWEDATKLNAIIEQYNRFNGL